MQKSASYYGQLLESYLDSNVSVDEANELFDFIKQQPDEARELLQASGGADYREKIKHLENIDESASRRMLERLLNAIAMSADQAQPVVHRIHFLKTSWFRYAAAIIIIVSGAAIWYTQSYQSQKSHESQFRQITADIPPGGNKAILTLADGTKIVLDNAANGNIAQQGNTKVIKLTNGELSYSAGGVLPLDKGVGGIVYPNGLFNTIATPRGGQYQIVLPDGTKVWLNAASSIKFPTVFTGNSREVEIAGEAYLEVAKNTKRPFYVHTNKATIQVLGTSFNVNAYTNEESIRTTLVEGSIRILSSRPEGGIPGNANSPNDMGSLAIARDDKGVILKPGQQAELTHNSQLTTHTADVDKVLAWKNGLFNLDGADFLTVMRQLERWYDIQIKIEGKIPQMIFKGKMGRDLNLSEVLAFLSKLDVKSRLDGRTLIVSGSER